MSANRGLRTSLLGIVACTALILAGCSGGGGSSSGEKPTLTMWVQTDPNYEVMAQQEAAEYETATGVHIELSYVPWAEFGAKLTAAFNAGSQPDLIEGVAAWVYGPKTGGQLSQLPDDLGSKMSEIADASQVPVEWEGEYYGMPLNVNIDGGPLTLYSVDAFQEAGITPQWSNWDAYVADMQKLTTTSNGEITRSGIEMVGGDQMVQFLNYFLQAGGTFYSADKSSVQIDNNYGEVALQTMYDLLNTYEVDSSNLTDFVGVASGTAASINYGPWYIAAAGASFPDFKWGWAELPLIPGSVGPYFPGTNVWAWMVPMDSQNKSAAWDYVRWLNGNEQRLAWSVQTGEIPAVKALWSDPVVANDPRWAPWLPFLDYQVALLDIGPQDAYSTSLNNMVMSVLLEQESIPAALETAQAELNQMLAGLPD